MITLSVEQQAIIDAPLAPLAVVACAGSGKTHTAVHRLLEIRRQMGGDRGRATLLSFSNIAVKTFRDIYHPLASSSKGVSRSGVEIDTIDGFITTNILRPHTARTMGCNRTPFLVSGSEPFLQNRDFQFWAKPATGAAFPVQRADIESVIASMNGTVVQFQFRMHKALIPINNGAAAVRRLGTIGAYTHSLGQYWALRTLQQQPLILKALAHRYPHILIDEAQDIGTLHQAILRELSKAGSQISLIGDPHQGIYDFAGADGTFLSGYGNQENVLSFPLTRNFRSVPSIVAVANTLSNREDKAERIKPELANGCYFIGYKKEDREKLIVAFQAGVLEAGLDLTKSAIVCRARATAENVAGTDAPTGQGLVKLFARAAVLRDKRQDYLGAFKTVAVCIVGLLNKPPDGLLASIIHATNDTEIALRREIWKFARSSTDGLPDAKLIADTHWHRLLVARVRLLLESLQKHFALPTADNLGNKLAKTALPNTSLMAIPDLATEQQVMLRIETVHKVKGEGLDALLYLAEKEHAAALLAGVDTELGRIGYVAVTRARNMIWLAVPIKALEELRPTLVARGFVEVGTA
ncbi:MAG: ATP-dependent helicase [Arenimonas sp.]